MLAQLSDRKQARRGIREAASFKRCKPGSRLRGKELTGKVEDTAVCARKL